MRIRYNLFAGRRLWPVLFFSCALGGVLPGQTPDLEIWQIQGVAEVSPYNGDLVRAAENIVTAVGEQFFFIQTPPARSDQDLNTSDGLMVYTGFSPGVRPGDLVTITGRIQEFGGQTQFGATGISITLVNTQQPLPEPVRIDGQFPGQNPREAPDLERVEGMLALISATTTGPSDERGWFPLRGGDERSFREPGVAYPGLNGFPVWDGNPEVFWMDPDGVGGPDNRFVTSGTLVDATAVVGQWSGLYLALPVRLELDGGVGLRPVREKKEDEFTVASINALQLIFGTPGYIDRVKKMARYIQEMMRLPDVVAFQEVGSQRVLDDLAVQLNLLAPDRPYDAYLINGEDNLQTGFLVSEALPVLRLEQLGAEERLSLGGRLHDRPPLLLEVRLGDETASKLRIMNLHLRSLRGIEGDDANFVRIKRYEQALSIARKVQAWRDDNLLLLGDFNAFPFTDGYVDVVNQIQGTSSLGALFPLQRIVQPPLENLTVDFLHPEERYSFVFEGNAQLLDHCLRNDLAGLAVRELAFARANADQPALFFENPQAVNRVSDHDGFVLFLSTDTSVPVAGPGPGLWDIRLPNPIGPGDVIKWTMEQPSAYLLTVVDALGQIRFRRRGTGADIHFSWPENLAPGWYAVHLQTERDRGQWKVVGR